MYKFTVFILICLLFIQENICILIIGKQCNKYKIKFNFFFFVLCVFVFPIIAIFFNSIFYEWSNMGYEKMILIMEIQDEFLVI